MLDLVRSRVTLVWLLLMLATGLSWQVGTDPSGDIIDNPAWMAVTVLLVAMFKIRLVLLHFMEVRQAPQALRLVCEAWVMLVSVSLIGMYLIY